MAERGIELAFFHESRTELEIRVRLVRMAHQHNLELRNRFIEAVLLEQEFAHLEMSKIVLSGYGKRSIPKSLGVVPVRSLDPRAPGQNSDDDWRSNRENFAAITKRLRKIDNRPGHGEVEADLRQISVTVCVRLTADLDQTDHRQEHDQVPKPTGDKIRLTLSKSEDRDRNQNEKRGCANCLPHWQLPGMRINRREIRRPNHLPDINEINR